MLHNYEKPLEICVKRFEYVEVVEVEEQSNLDKHESM